MKGMKFYFVFILIELSFTIFLCPNALRVSRRDESSFPHNMLKLYARCINREQKISPKKFRLEIARTNIHREVQHNAPSRDFYL